MEFSVYGPVTAVGQVLDQMRTLGRGTIVFINGGTSVRPRPDDAGTSIAFSGESAYAQVLHEVLADQNAYATPLVIPGAIAASAADASARAAFTAGMPCRYTSRE